MSPGDDAAAASGNASGTESVARERGSSRSRALASSSIAWLARRARAGSSERTVSARALAPAAWSASRAIETSSDSSARALPSWRTSATTNAPSATTSLCGSGALRGMRSTSARGTASSGSRPGTTHAAKPARSKAASALARAWARPCAVPSSSLMSWQLVEQRLRVFRRIHVLQDLLDLPLGRDHVGVPRREVREALRGRAVVARDLPVLVGEELEGEVVLLREFGVVLRLVARDAEDHDVLLLVLLGEVAEPATFLRSPAGVGLGIEPHDDPLPLEVGERDGAPVVSGRGERGRGISDLELGVDGSGVLGARLSGEREGDDGGEEDPVHGTHSSDHGRSQATRGRVAIDASRSAITVGTPLHEAGRER